MALFRYPGSKVWWYDFRFDKRRYRESTKSRSKLVAADAQKARQRQLEQDFNSIRPRPLLKTFTEAASEYITAKRGIIENSSLGIEEQNIRRLMPVFGRKLLNEITPQEINEYQHWQVARGYRPKTAKLDASTLRAILRRNHLWESIRADVRIIHVSNDEIGIALTDEQEQKLIHRCRASRSRSLYPGVVLALNTGMRSSEIRLLRWQNVDLDARAVRVGKSKTEAGTGRRIPLNDFAFDVLSTWAEKFPERKPEHFVFTSEKVGAVGRGAVVPRIYATDPTKPIRWKSAWTRARKDSGVWARFHDLRHTAVTRMIAGHIPVPNIGRIVGWSSSTLTLMITRYGHLYDDAAKRAVELLDRSTRKETKKPPRSYRPKGKPRRATDGQG